MAWSANGRYLAFVEEDDSMGINRKIWILDTVKWKRIQLLSSKEIIEKVVWLNNGKLIVLARSDSPKPSDSSKKLQESPNKPAMIKCWSVSIAPLPK
jgi:Tol biopolymer transport system component